MSAAALPQHSPAEATLQDVLAAINCLFSTTILDSNLKHQSDVWLQAFSQTQVSWTLCDQMLSLPAAPTAGSDATSAHNAVPEHVHYFAANTLRNKLLIQYYELPDPTARLSLRDSILQHLLSFIQHHSSTVLLTRISMCLSVSIVQLIGHSEMHDAIPLLLQIFTSSYQQHAQNPQFIVQLFQILTFLAEDTENERLAIQADQRDAVRLYLQSQGQSILQLLHSTLTSTTPTTELQRQIFGCYTAWVRDVQLGRYYDILTHPLMQLTLNSFNTHGLEEQISELLSEIIRTTPDVSPTSVGSTVLLPQVLSLITKFDAAVEDDNDELAKKISQVFVDIGEQFLPYISDLQQYALQCVECILHCARHVDKDISSNTFNFWFMLTEDLQRQSQKFQNEQHQPTGMNGNHTASDSNVVPASQQPITTIQQHQQRVDIFVPYFLRLMDAVRSVMKYPLNYSELSEDEIDDLKRYRYFAAETLLDACVVVGANRSLQYIWQSIQTEYELYQRSQHQQWHGLEAALYCIRSIARRINNDEDTILPQLFNILPDISQGNSNLRYTSTMIVGRYADWISTHQKYIPQMMSFVVDGLGNKEITGSASMAFKYVCEGNSQYLAQPHFLQQLYEIYGKSINLQLEDRIEVLMGICSVISTLPEAEFTQAFQRLIVPLGEQIQQAVNAHQASASNNNAHTPNQHHEGGVAGLIPALDCLGHCFRGVEPANNNDVEMIPRVAADIAKQLQPLLQQVLQSFIRDDRKMERLCRCLKYQIRCCKIHFLPLLNTWIELLIQAYQASPHSAFLYIISITVDMYGSLPQYQQSVLPSVLDIFTHSTLPILQSTEAFTQNPDLVEDYYELCSRLLQRCPHILFDNLQVQQIFAAAMYGLHLQHREALNALMHFFTLFFSEGVTQHRSGRPTHQKPKDTHVQVVNQCLQQYGQQFVVQLIEGVAGALPPARIQNTVSVFLSLLDVNPTLTQEYLQQALQMFPRHTVNPTKEQFLKQLLESHGPRFAREALESFSKAARLQQTPQLTASR